MNIKTNAVEIEDVSMRFNLMKNKVDSLKEYIIKFLKKQLLFTEFYALRGITCNIKKGQSFAVIGENGSGKSTLLKLISGVFSPTEGKIRVNGTIAPLIELGAGFDMELTARENIYLNGAILGHDRKYMNEKFDEIIEFSELQEFVDVPVKNYSSGMISRLGFSIATLTSPDIMIVDEILSVGDLAFQEKCMERLGAMLEGNTTLIYVSHSIEQVEELCTHALWLKHGQKAMFGEVSEVIPAYVEYMSHKNDGVADF